MNSLFFKVINYNVKNICIGEHINLIMQCSELEKFGVEVAVLLSDKEVDVMGTNRGCEFLELNNSSAPVEFQCHIAGEY